MTLSIQKTSSSPPATACHHLPPVPLSGKRPYDSAIRDLETRSLLALEKPAELYPHSATD